MGCPLRWYYSHSGVGNVEMSKHLAVIETANGRSDGVTESVVWPDGIADDDDVGGNLACDGKIGVVYRSGRCVGQCERDGVREYRGVD